MAVGQTSPMLVSGISRPCSAQPGANARDLFISRNFVIDDVLDGWIREFRQLQEMKLFQKCYAYHCKDECL